MHMINTLCDFYGATAERRQELLALAEAAKVKGWFHPYSDVLSSQFDTYVGLEGVAAAIFAYESERVHGLFQTEEYAREMFMIPGSDGKERDPEEVERRVQVRLGRQAILTRSDGAPARLDWVLSEAVLRRRVGTPAITAGQLNRIAEIGDMPSVSVRVIPFSAGLHQGVVTGPFARLHFAEDFGMPDAIYADNFMGHLLLTKKEQVARFAAAITAMRSCSLDTSKSQDLIHRASKEHLRA